MNEELVFHLDERSRDLMRAGIDPTEARRRARVEFGSIEARKEEMREAVGLRLVDELRGDVTYALRQCCRAPGFSTIAVMTLALGIGANTAIFSVVQAIVLKPLPFKDSDRVVQLMMNAPADESPTRKPLRAALPVTVDALRELQQHTRTLSHVGMTGGVLYRFVTPEGATALQGARVSAAIFDMLAARPILGRVFRAADEDPSADLALILSFTTWQRVFGGDAGILGRVVTLDAVIGRAQYQFTVVGVMPPGFQFPNPQTEYWTSFRRNAKGGGGGPLMARLADNTSLDAATAEIGSLLRALRPDAPSTRYELVRAQNELIGPVKPALVVLSIAVAFVLLIAIANVANLFLARGAVRQREIAIRTAIGAGRARLIRQLITESMVLAGLGGIVGTALAIGGVEGVQGLAATLSRLDLPPGLTIPRLDEVVFDRTVWGFTTLICLLTGGLFGLAPALRQSDVDPIETLRDPVSASAGLSPSRGWGLRGLLVISEVALATMLLIGAGLLLGSVTKLLAIDPGYDAHEVLTFQVRLPPTTFPSERVTGAAEDLVKRLRSIPGIRQAAYANQLPTVNLKDSAGGLWRTPDPARGGTSAFDARLISRDYLSVMGIKVVAGRAFGENDDAGQPRVVLINQALARRDFDGEDPIGQTVYVGRDVVPWQIAGVVEDIRQSGLDQPAEPQFFMDMRQYADGGPLLFPVGAYYVVRTEADPSALIAAIRRAVHDFDPEAAVFNVAQMDQLLDVTTAQPRLYATLLGIFATVGTVLALIGIYGLVAYAVARRTKEIGIRMALGADRASVIRLVVGESAVLIASGLAIGLAAAAGITQYLQGMLFGLTPLDFRIFVSVSILFGIVALAASLVPARRATRVDPLVALRWE
jgi:predicted permease